MTAEAQYIIFGVSPRARQLRRAFGVLLVSLGMLHTGGAWAQPYPSKPIKFVVPFPPGGGNDLLARIAAAKMSESMKQPVVVDNRPGASGQVGTQFVARSPADGYTIITAGTTLTVTQTVQKNVPYDVLKDFTPISLMVLQPMVLVSNTAFPAKTLKDLIALARAQPGKLNYGVGADLSAPHLASELWKAMAGGDIVHIPYNGAAPALNAVLANQVSFVVDNPATSMPHIQAGKLRALGVTSTSRLAQLADVPTIAESGLPGYEINSWFGVLAPANTPKPIADLLSAEFAKALQAPDIRERLTQQGFTVVGSTVDQFGAHLKTDIENWKRIVQVAGVKVE